jgi:non-heme chloroperoxidase
VARYVAKYGKGRVAKAVLISAIPPTCMQSERNPEGVSKAVVNRIRDGTAFDRSQFYLDITIPFYGFNRPGAVVSEGIRQNWWRQWMTASHRRLVKGTILVDFQGEVRVVVVIDLIPDGC